MNNKLNSTDAVRRAQAQKTRENLYYEKASDSVKDSEIYDKLKLESDTLTDEFLKDLAKLAVEGKLTSDADIDKYFEGRKLPWGKPGNLWWIKQKLREANLINF